MKCDSPTENAKPELKEQSYPVVACSPNHRRVIFPSLYSKRCEEDSTESEAHEETVKKSPVTSTPLPLTRDEKDQQLLDALSSHFWLRSPSLPSKSSRLCDELGLEIPSMSLTDDDTDNQKPRSTPNAKAVNSQHFAPNPSQGVTRALSMDRKFPPSRGKIDRSRLVRSPPAPSRQTASCPSSPRETPPSILRPSRRASSFPKVAASDMTLPPLVPCGDSTSSNETLHSLHSQSSFSEHSDFTPGRLTRSVSFDARVWVVEYERTPEEIERAWFSPQELEHFRKQTIARLVAHNTELLPSGTGFVVQRGSLPSRAVFALPSMSSVAEDDDDVDGSEVESAVNEEIQNILVVDPHDLCAKLFTRDFKRMVPNVNVCTACSSEEARKRMAETKRIDIMIVEERLKAFHRHAKDQWVTMPELGLSSGSEFIKALAQQRAALSPEDSCLFIAVSAHLDKDKKAMQKSGADFIWAKPPPPMDEIVRDVLLKALLVKREKHALAERLFGSVMGSP